MLRPHRPHRPYRWKLTALATLTALWAFACRQASYEIIGPKKGEKTNSTAEPDPEKPDGTPEGKSPFDQNQAPTAKVEVIWQGRSVTKVRVNEPTTIRPSADTLDPDDLGRSSCANPGIVKADYDVGGEAKPSVSRGQGCETLGVPYTFKKAGDYLITLVVTTAENETAFASMTLHVIDAGTSLDDDGGFRITARPLLVERGQEVMFTGLCTTRKSHTISWDFGDGAKGTGKDQKHAYQQTGQYRVDAVCTETENPRRSWKAAVTIVVVDKMPPGVVVPPGEVPDPNPPATEQDPGPGPGPGPGRPGQGPGQDPGQDPRNPGYDPGQVGKPGAPGGPAPKKKCHLFFGIFCH